MLILLKKTWASLKRYGPKVTIGRVRYWLRFKLKQIINIPDTSHIISQEQRTQQANHSFSRSLCISILVPLYNTPLPYLKEMIESVCNQTYAHWELCLADASDGQHHQVQVICEQYAARDQRVVYHKLAQNGGIAANTNACIHLAHGDYLALLDHDDILHPSALFEVTKAVCDTGADYIFSDEKVFSKRLTKTILSHYKSDYAPDTLRSYNYLCHLSVISSELMDKVGGFREGFEGSQDFDLVLRVTEQARQIVHIPQVLYYWRAHRESVAGGVEAKPYAIDSAKRAIREHLERVGLKGEVFDSPILSTYRVAYEIDPQPLITIIIPNKDHVSDLDKCLRSILDKTTYPNYEILIVENNSEEQSTFAYYQTLSSATIRVLHYPNSFNFSAINNFAVEHACGDVLLFLNNDIEIITPNWLQEMLMFAQRLDVGAVGPKMYYADNTIQHGGVITGIAGFAGHAHRHFQRDAFGYLGRLALAQNLSAVTGACLMVRKAVFEQVGGFDEKFAVALNDIDLCMRIREAGYLNVFTPYAELYHYESKSRGYEEGSEKEQRFESEKARFRTRWKAELAAGDPYYNPNLTLEREDFSPRTGP
jgi:GT2 family glycosyltransferase